jgi:CRP-like cAMP-binding protein
MKEIRQKGDRFPACGVFIRSAAVQGKQRAVSRKGEHEGHGDSMLVGPEREMTTASAVLLAKLERRDRVSEEERRALQSVLEPERRYRAGEAIIMEGDRPGQSTLLVSGFAGRQSSTLDGRRSLTQLSIAGDFVDLHSLLMKQMDHGVVALTDCRVSTASHTALIALIAEHPHLGRLLWLDTVIDGAVHRQWLHRMGRQEALGRLAHFLCEIDARLAAVGLSADSGFDVPLSQVEVADCLGISPVHANRTLMELRRLGLVEWRGVHVRLPDRTRLQRLAQFDPTYLRLERDPV